MRFFLNAAMAVVLATAPMSAQNSPDLQMKYALVLTRHGVRPPLWTAAQLNAYSAQPWPDWGVPVGYLTAHGRVLMTMMGGFYREWFDSQKLLGGSACGTGKTYWWSDVDQRNMESSKAMSAGLLPECPAQIHRVPEGAVDPLFNAVSTGTTVPNPDLEFAAVASRLGPDQQAVVAANRPAFEALDRVLRGGGKATYTIFDNPAGLSTTKAGITLGAPLALAGTLAEDLLLEYTDGMSGNRLGWGRVDRDGILQIMQLHAASWELMIRTPAVARTKASNLLSHLERSLEQAATGKPVAGALGVPATALLVVSGHDSDIASIGGLLGLSWQLPTYQRDDTPPGSAMIFSVWRSTSTGRNFVRVQYVAQTMDQMHDTIPLSLSAPPAIRDVFVPGCSSSASGVPCEWAAFREVVLAKVAPPIIEK